MVRTRIIFCLIFFFISVKLFSMNNDVELTPIYQKTTPTKLTEVTDDNCKEFVATIDDAINQKFPPRNLLKLILNPLTEKDMLAIVNIITIFLHITPNKQLIDALYAKNVIFAQAIDFFSNLVRTSLDSATCSNLNTLLNPKVQQPTAQLNQLTEAIREYIIDRVVSTIEYEYKITLTEKTPIRAFTICFHEHLAAISSDGNPLRLWNLKTGKPLDDSITFNEEHTPDQICFNCDASQIATASCKQAPKTVKIWSPKTGKLLHSLSHTFDIDLIGSYPSRSQLAVFTNDRESRYIQIWSIDENSAKSLMSTRLPYHIDDDSSDNRLFFYNCKNFEAHHPKMNIINKSTLYVTCKQRGALYLLQNIIAKASLGTSLEIERLKPYLDLTDYEIGLIQAEKSKKIAAFKAISDKQKQTSEKLLTNK